jgi:biotin carboxylase
LDDVKAAFGNIIGKVNGLGLVNSSLLVQEFLEGQEYVVDMVSRDGVHKVAALWAYDRRAANGGGFVCFGQKLLVSTDEHCAEIIAYEKRVLDALGIKNGPSHGEVKWFKGEPVLVEVGARCHGAEGAWKDVSQLTYGCDQVQMAIDAYLIPEAFAAAQDMVSATDPHLECMLVAYCA